MSALTLMGGASRATGSKSLITGMSVFRCNTRLQFGAGVELQEQSPCVGVISTLDVVVDSTRPAIVINVCPVVCNLVVDFNYNEGCTVGLQAPLGEAEGVARVTGLMPMKIDPGNPNKLASMSTLAIPFSWLRIGAAAIVVTGNFAGPNKWNGPDYNGKKKEAVSTNSGTKQYKDTIGGIGVATFLMDPLPCPDLSKAVTITGAFWNIA
jgi:hypothetical protein